LPNGPFPGIVVVVHGQRDLVEETIDATLAPGRPVTIVQLVRAVTLRVAGSDDVATSRMVGAGRILVVLRAYPNRYLEVAPGTWVRRGDGPEAGVGSRRPRPPLAGGAAAMATPPQEPVHIDAVARPILPAG
jgi:hypothetical protein